ncbi:MAG: PfkB family carbohydrate kinase [Marinifilaceae bacterium]
MTETNQKELLAVLADKLQQNFTPKHLMVGFDGFVDEIIHIVDQRKNPDEYERIKTIGEYAERIGRAAGLSANIEMVPVQVKLGGNGPIMANGLIAQDFKVSYIGSLGKTKIHDVFEDFASKCEKVISVTDPAHTDALEFMDGKLMMGKMNKLPEVNWNSLMEKITRDELKQMVSKSGLITFNNWTMLSEMNTIIEGMLEILSELDQKPGVFVDLADPQKRTDDDIKGVLELIRKLGEQTQMILSMNKNESFIVAGLLNIEEEDVVERAQKIREALNISHVVIHPLHGAAVATANEACWVTGPYTKTPMLTTGAGDNFNAGFCNGWLKGLSPEECIATGVFTSGYYVRNCYSPNREELIGFIQSYCQ